MTRRRQGALAARDDGLCPGGLPDAGRRRSVLEAAGVAVPTRWAAQAPWPNGPSIRSTCLLGDRPMPRVRKKIWATSARTLSAARPGGLDGLQGSPESASRRALPRIIVSWITRMAMPICELPGRFASFGRDHSKLVQRITWETPAQVAALQTHSGVPKYSGAHPDPATRPIGAAAAKRQPRPTG